MHNLPGLSFASPRAVCYGRLSKDFSLLVAFLLVTFSWFFRGFFVAFSWPSSV